jgi:hypothetical protein
MRPDLEVDVLSVETWDRSYRGTKNTSRWDQLVQYGAPYSTRYSTERPLGTGHATVSTNSSFIGVDSKAYYSPGWTFWAMPFGCLDILDAGNLGAGQLKPTRTASTGCEGFYINNDGYALNRDYMVPAYNMSDYYQIFPTWSDGANVAGYRRDKVSPVSFLPAARLGHYRTWTYGRDGTSPDFNFQASPVTKRLVIILNWDFSPRTLGGDESQVPNLPPVRKEWVEGCVCL